ncbi:MAG: shikimate dehydrogenase [Candidatus Acidiferrales bacterium]
MLFKDRICAIVAARDARGMLRQLRRALRLTRTVELRLDWLETESKIRPFLGSLKQQGAGSPRVVLIATCRRQRAGGRFRGNVTEQLRLLQLAMKSGCRGIDIEIETAEARPASGRLPSFAPARSIISFHEFKRTPQSLRQVIHRLNRIDESAMVKLAALAHSLADARRILDLARRRKNVIAVPMGEVALPARILALREGSALAYAPVETAIAPGQISLDEMKNLYRADRLDRRTRVYGVIGDPVSHSLGRVLHNAGFHARRVNAVYLPFLVRDLRDFLSAIRPFGIRGFSVTLPHKEGILRHLDECDPLAERIGAVNTVVVRGSGELVGYNTDYVGVLRALERRVTLGGSRVLILGAGGAARAVAFALAQGHATVYVCARRMKRAEVLARAVGGEAIPRSQLKREAFDAIVNATPVGMHPRLNESPLAVGELNCRLVFDLIYRPRETKLLQLARRRGIETVSGLVMFLAQGAAQWEIWMGERAPEAAMHRAVAAALRREERAGKSR